MAYTNTNYYGDQGQTTVTYNYQQPHQYSSPHYQYDQQNQYPYQQQQSFPLPPPSPQPPAYQPSEYNSYNNNSYNNQPAWNNNNYQQPQYQNRSSVYSPQPQQQQSYPQQQYTPAHATYAPPTGPQTGGITHQRYQYSDLRGKRKALLIGCNYANGKSPLRGCINDVHNIKDFLIKGYHFQPNNMWIMTDDQTDPRNVPTRANIITGMQWLASNAQPGDDLFLHFSGHGGPVEDVDGDEDDGHDEAIVPTDADTITNGPKYIVDDLIHDLCVKPLPQGCRLTAIFDCCHSGSIMDLPYIYSTKGVLKEPSFFKDTGSGLLHVGAAYLQEDLGGMIVNGAGLLKKMARHASGRYKKVREAKTSPADVICFSGCKDAQTSMDAHLSNQSQGAMSHAFKSSLIKYGGNLSYIQLLNAIREALAEGNFEQKPQLSACHPIDLDLLFTL